MEAIHTYHGIIGIDCEHDSINITTKNSRSLGQGKLTLERGIQRKARCPQFPKTTIMDKMITLTHLAVLECVCACTCVFS